MPAFAKLKNDINPLEVSDDLFGEVMIMLASRPWRISTGDRMMTHLIVGIPDELDVAAVARQQIRVSGCEARPIMLARAANYRRRGRLKTASFWQSVADVVKAISDSAQKE
jgi:hypothetical protein